ncbi:DUF2550 domain-containing protein [Acidipropionibacterium virtanenii]|uniref:DUF2550 domain-containing protein n=1 Tax=Acidipropionibacterium virtanenii TaxID=2057246 RepID=A0A344UTW2_9ACTN|nr:DUF2550 domain-containing protein [Acidipropionibacterium virtanenii]AXE38710.1 hypothetical protein JS278_01546 [Acidipropionibacterium virtanenii]
MGPIEFAGQVPLLSTLEVELVLAAAVVVVVALAMLWLVVRHQLLLRRRGVFVCAFRTLGGARAGRWMLGVAQYASGTFRWYRPIKPLMSPSIILRRGGMEMIEHHRPTGSDGVPFIASQVVVTLRTPLPGRISRCQLAVDPGVLTGLMSWLEAGPPGGLDYVSAAHH